MEEWKDLLEHNNYEISNYGNIKNKTTRHILKPQIKSGGYAYIGLRIDGTKKHYSLHRLVVKYFVSGEKEYFEVNHIDGNKLNNRFDNLEWISHKENMKHAHDSGLNNKFTRNSKLTETQVLEIFNSRSLKGAVQLAKEYNVNVTTIRDIINRKSWTHITKN